MKNIDSGTIVFITGAFVGENCWDEWKLHFERQGYQTHVPAWPHKDAPAEVLRSRQPDPEIASNRLTGLIAYYADIIKSLPEKPILIGHSIGGLVIQILLQRGMATAGVAIHSVPPRGVITFKWSFFKAAWGPLGFFTPLAESYLMSFREWQYAFTNNMTCEEQKTSYYKFLVPESKRIVRDGLTKAASLDFSRPHAPLLFIAGTNDNFIPASLNYSNYKKYSDKGSVTDYKVFEGRNHFVLGQPTWKEDADYILAWIRKQGAIN